MEGILVLFALALLGGGAIALLLGVVAFFSQGGIRKRLTVLEAQVYTLSKTVSAAKQEAQAESVPVEKPREEIAPAAPKTEEVITVVASPQPVPEFVSEVVTAAKSVVEEKPAPIQSEPVKAAEPPIEKSVPRVETPAISQESEQGLEMMFGTKWLLWAGIAVLLFGVAFFVKYAYDNAWIGPQGRLFIGVMTGLGMLVAGERFRRKSWTPLFQAFTGGGCAIFYICVYFSFHVYHLSSQELSFGLATLVTALTIALAVVHNALPIGVLALVGGFLSPVLLSTGENKPYALFSYLLILDMVALGAAYYRKWRVLDFVAFIGTSILYMGWFTKFYSPLDQMTPALLFATIFYALFLVIPSLYHLVRRAPMGGDGLALLVLNAIFAFSCYCRILYGDHQQALGFVILAQAALMFGLFQALRQRLPEDRSAQESVLVIALALAITALPMHFKLYGVVLAWAVEGALFLYLGVRYSRLVLRLGGVAALALSVLKLFGQLPLHREFFLPIFNAPFGSWLFVAALLIAGSVWLSRNSRPIIFKDLQVIVPGLFVIGYVLASLLFMMEVDKYWIMQIFNNSEALSVSSSYLHGYRISMEIVLCAIYVGITAYLAGWMRKGQTETNVSAAQGMLVLLAAYLFGSGVFFLYGFWRYDSPPAAFSLLNQAFLSRLALIASFWGAAALLRKRGVQAYAEVVSFAAHGMLMILLAVEVMQLPHTTDFISRKMAVGLISAVWGAQAFGLILWGLLTQRKTLRILGFLLFGVSVGKVFLYDMGELEAVFRIAAFMGLGVCLVLAGYCYQRFSSLIKPLALLVILGAVGQGAYAETNWNDWQAHAAIEIPAEVKPNGFARLELPPTVLDQGLSDLRDVRVIDAQGNLTPFLLYWEVPRELGKTVWKSVTLRNQAWQPGQYARVELTFSEKVDKTSLKVQLDGTNFRRKGYVEASADGTAWERIGEEQFLFSVDTADNQFRADTLTFPVNNAPFLRLTISAMPDDPQKIEVRNVEYALEKPAEKEATVPYSGFKVKTTRDLDKKTTTLEIDLGVRNLPVSLIRLPVADPYFYRAWTLEGRNAEKEKVARHTETETLQVDREAPWQFLQNGFIYRIQDGSKVFTSTNIHCFGVGQRYLRLTMQDGDNPPLNVNTGSIQIEWLQPMVVFAVAPGTSYKLLWNNAKATAPVFDLAQSVRNIKVSDLPRLKMAAPQVAAAKAEPLAPWTERYSTALTLLMIIAALAVGGMLVQNMRQVHKGE